MWWDVRNRYAYPSMFPEQQQNTFVTNTEHDAELLATPVSTAWEFAAHWGGALAEYFPKFARRGVVDALVGVNVPYNIPVLAFGSDKFKVMQQTNATGSRSVVFAPHEWRGTGGSTLPWAGRENMNVTAMAADINGYPRGTVTAIYLTSDGGGNLDDIDTLVNSYLAEHVEVVGAEIGKMALAASENRVQYSGAR